MPSLMPMESNSFRTPNDIGGIDGWWEANSITGLANGAGVASWPDDSGAWKQPGLTANQPTCQANVVNGLPIVRFVSASLNNFSCDGIKPEQKPITFAAVLQLPSLPPHRVIFSPEVLGHLLVSITIFSQREHYAVS